MNLRLLYALSLLLLAQQSPAQIPPPDFQWARRIGSSGGALVTDLTVNAEGDPHLTGYFVGSISFGSYTLQGDIFSSFFVAKYSRAGNLIWAKQGTNAPDGGSSGGGVAVDKNGNVYVCARVYGSSGTFENTVIDANRGAIVLLKYDPAGQLLWARQTGGGRRSYGTDVALDDAGNAYMVGIVFVQSIYRDLLLAKYDGAGNLLWTNSYIVNNSDRTSPIPHISVDADGTSYLTSYFAVLQAVIAGTTLVNRGGYDVLFLKHDRQGALVWARSAGGSANDGPAGVAKGSSDNDGYITGSIGGSALFGNISATNTSGSARLFVARYDDSGTCHSVRVGGGTGSSAALGVAVDRQGGAYITGQYNGLLELDGTTYPSNRFSAAFVARYEPSGQLTWARTISGMVANVYGGPAAVDGNNNLFIAGWFNGTANFGNTTLTSSSGSDIYLAKLPAWPPLLYVSRTGSSLKLTWSTNAAGFFLESRTDLSSAQGWSQGPMPILEGDRYAVVTNLTAASQYFRLHSNPP